MSRHLWSNSRRPKSRHQRRSGSEPQHLSVFAATIRAVTGRVEQVVPAPHPDPEETDWSAPQFGSDTVEPPPAPQDAQGTQIISRKAQVDSRQTPAGSRETPTGSPGTQIISREAPTGSPETQLISPVARGASPVTRGASPVARGLSPVIRRNSLEIERIPTGTERAYPEDPGIPEDGTVEFPQYNDSGPAGPALSLLSPGRHSMR